ncbi:MAG: hypothetical protein J6B48_04040 [Clostridia bacterium]|nr:hypothetical protein [Clostridia bacterium]
MKETTQKYYKALADKVGGEQGIKIAEAIRDMYTLYKPEMIDWFANLYDPTVGGYYYSNGARDNEKIGYQGKCYDLRPDTESTEQALRFISTSGLLGDGTLKEKLPAWMQEQIVRYIKGLQDPNGFFYNPQWPKELTDSKLSRRARDLGWCVSILENLGSAPTYDTPTGVKGDGLDIDGKPVKVIGESSCTEREEKPKSSVAIPKELENKESFINYLNSLDIKHNSYSVGNTLTAIAGQIIYRDRELEAAGADYSLRKIIIDWLNENQNPENGLWHETANYYGVNGLMKTSGVYGKIGVLMPHADKAVKSAIDAISTDQTPGAVTDIYNTWFAVTRIKRHLRTHGGDEGQRMADKIVEDLRKMAPEAIRITKEKLSVFAKPYGSFSYTPMASAGRSQGMPVTFRGAYEGDVNATIICSSDILGYMYSALELSDVRVPIYSPLDFERYIEILEKNRAKIIG